MLVKFCMFTEIAENHEIQPKISYYSPGYSASGALERFFLFSGKIWLFDEKLKIAEKIFCKTEKSENSEISGFSNTP